MTDEAQSLDAIIKGNAEEVQVEQEAAPNVQKDEQPKVDKPAPTAEGNESWTKTAVLDERRKRQELEAKLAEYEKNLTKTEEVKRPDVYEDPEGAFKHTESQFANALLFERINLSRELMADKFEDYAAMENVFVEMVKSTPVPDGMVHPLVHEMNQSANPAKFAYNKAKEHSEYLDFQKTKDSEDYKAFLEARKSGAFDKPVEDSPEVKRNKSAVKVPDLINATSAKSGHTEGEKTLKQLLGR